MSFLRSPFVQHLLGILQVVSACFMAWKGACLLSGTPYPAVVVITNSMAPAFDPGDILLVHRHPAHDGRVRVGDLPVILNPDRPFPFIHRVVGVFYDDNQEEMVLTKGDNNELNDSVGMMYPGGQEYISRREIAGFVRGYVPLLGWVVIFLQDPVRTMERLLSSGDELGPDNFI
ncbi:Signal peptidase complex catalytic subunit S11C [Podospora pseudocomata]|uniref:Signal peptidase complex catalytic subunit SEC11 n=4 Tax=Podospora TaxID=5144 RepID=A0ABY6SJN6_PODCO|nr:Signal peptidase complex catalytic subunit S11C [Podospora bellae-mahoneyi]KAK4649985.1 Signal peptidase complex catalytic subunit S11C [Podospora pseudocomata]KAK4667930.1 Signal peptidase complex catalytic subunit S11C [Podospora pseudoanserina]VBB86302.1 Putative signal peptidase complex catalytic subunit SEC11C [Podospora comata]